MTEEKALGFFTQSRCHISSVVGALIALLAPLKGVVPPEQIRPAASAEPEMDKAADRLRRTMHTEHRGVFDLRAASKKCVANIAAGRRFMPCLFVGLLTKAYVWPGAGSVMQTNQRSLDRDVTWRANALSRDEACFRVAKEAAASDGQGRL